ncbi:predicted protein [Streptomyces sp. AA4]|nr:predicted protein [Streptomyces sp. AA4]
MRVRSPCDFGILLGQLDGAAANPDVGRAQDCVTETSPVPELLPKPTRRGPEPARADRLTVPVGFCT